MGGTTKWLRYKGTFFWGREYPMFYGNYIMGYIYIYIYSHNLLVGGLEHEFYDFPYIGNNNLN